MDRELIYFQADIDSDGNKGHTVFRSYPRMRPHFSQFFKDDPKHPSKDRAKNYVDLSLTLARNL